MSSADLRSAILAGVFDPIYERPVSGALRGRSLSGGLRRKLTGNRGSLGRSYPPESFK